MKFSLRIDKVVSKKSIMKISVLGENKNRKEIIDSFVISVFRGTF